MSESDASSGLPPVVLGAEPSAAEVLVIDTPPDDRPRALANAFCAACAASDEAAARTTATVSGWAAAQGLFRQVTRKGLNVSAFGASFRAENRAVVQVVLSHPDRPRPLGDLYLLMENTDGLAIVGVVKPHAHASMFLRGVVDGHTTPAELPASESAEAWAALVMTEVAMGTPPAGLPSELAERLAADTAPELAGSASLAVANRSAVGFRFADGTDIWVVLGEDNTPLRTGFGLSFDLLLSGVELSFPEEGRPPEAAEEVSATERDARIRQTVTDAIRALGIDALPADDPRREAGERMQALVDAALNARAEADPKAPTPEAKTFDLPPKMKEAVERYMASEIVAGRLKPGEIGVDEAFIRAHGAGLTGALITGFFEQAAPKGLAFDVPVPPDPGSTEPKQVTLRVDFGSILGKLFQKPTGGASS